MHGERPRCSAYLCKCSDQHQPGTMDETNCENLSSVRIYRVARSATIGRCLNSE